MGLPNFSDKPQAEQRRLKEIFNDVSRHPSIEFEQQNDLTDIGGYYNMPRGMSAAEYEDWFWGTNTAQLEAKDVAIGDGKRYMSAKQPSSHVMNSWLELKALNPELENVRLDENLHYDVYCAVMGVTSGFNIDDINFFLEQLYVGHGYPAVQGRNMPTHGERLERIEDVSEERMSWVPSPRTAQRIESQFQAKGLLPK